MDPFSLIAAGVGTVGSLAGGIYNAATAGARKKKWKEQQRQEALHQLRRQRAAELGAEVGGDGAHIAQGIDRQADEQFAIDPMSFVPFVQNATKLGSAVYDGVKQDGRDQKEEDDRWAPQSPAYGGTYGPAGAQLGPRPTDPEELRYWGRQR